MVVTTVASGDPIFPFFFRSFLAFRCRRHCAVVAGVVGKGEGGGLGGDAGGDAADSVTAFPVLQRQRQRRLRKRGNGAARTRLFFAGAGGVVAAPADGRVRGSPLLLEAAEVAAEVAAAAEVGEEPTTLRKAALPTRCRSFDQVDSKRTLSFSMFFLFSSCEKGDGESGWGRNGVD